MKTIMDAVNELMGDINNAVCAAGELLHYNTSSGKFIIFFFKEESDLHRYVCTIGEFNALVSELQNWQPTKKPFSKFERDIELSLFDHNWIVGIIYDSFDTLHEFDVQSLSLRYPENANAIQVIDLTTMLDSCSSLYQQFECAVIAKLEEERQNV